MALPCSIRHGEGSFPRSLARFLGWAVLSTTGIFLINNFLTFGVGLPGPYLLTDGGPSLLGVLQLTLYPVACVCVVVFISQTSNTSLDTDAQRASELNVFFIRGAFWAVLLVGLVDMSISFLRVEGLLDYLVGEELSKDLGRARFRGPWVHVPLIIAGYVAASFTKTLGFHWLALLIVVAELLIVLFRFIFSYEQAFMADLVRFWYGAFFLFASAFTLLEGGHVRVDIIYANLSSRIQDIINAVGAVLLGLTVCWTILISGMGQKTSTINSPVFNFETTQSGFGMYVKYLMAAFLAVFAISMMIQFVSSFFGSLHSLVTEKADADRLP